jgi:hypothetical protein
MSALAAVDPALEAAASKTDAKTVGIASALSSVLTIALVGILVLTVRLFRQRKKRNALPEPTTRSFGAYDNRSLTFNSLHSKFSAPGYDEASVSTVSSS